MKEMNFSRRKFIAGLLSISAVPAVVKNLYPGDDVPDNEEVWRAIEEQPITFSVEEDGALGLPYDVSPSNRWEAYDLWKRDQIPSRNELTEVVERLNYGFEAVRRWKDNNFPYLEDFDQDDWEGDELQDYAGYLKYSDWVDELDDSAQAIVFIRRLSENHYHNLALEMKKWAESGDFGPEEWEEFDYPFSGQYYAFCFFGMQDIALLEALNVKVIEGDRPGSTYYAAELNISPEEANRRAADLRIPVRFEQQTRGMETPPL